MFGGYFCLGWSVRAAAAEARSQVAASQMMIKDRKVFILFIHYSSLYLIYFSGVQFPFGVHSFNFWLVGFWLVGFSPRAR